MNEQSALLEKMFRKDRPNGNRSRFQFQHHPLDHAPPVVDRSHGPVHRHNVVDRSHDPVHHHNVVDRSHGPVYRHNVVDRSHGPVHRHNVVDRSHDPVQPLQWLLHSCTRGFNLTSMAQACEAVLDELGWETTARMATRWSHPMETDTQASSRSRKAFVVATTTDEIQLSRITGTPSVIFVLDTTPASLIKTYGQIKSLIGQRNDLGSRLGLVFVSPFGDGRERLLASCQHFLSIQPRDLGTVSRSLIDDAERHWPNAARNWAESVAKDWHPFVARCLDQQLT